MPSLRYPTPTQKPTRKPYSPRPILLAVPKRLAATGATPGGGLLGEPPMDSMTKVGATTTVATVQRWLDCKDADIRRGEESIAKLRDTTKTDRRCYQQARGELGDRIVGLQKELSGVQDQLDAANQEIKRLHAELGAARSERDSLQSELKAANITIGEYIAELDALAHKHEETTAAERRLHRDVAVLQDQLKVARLAHEYEESAAVERRLHRDILSLKGQLKVARLALDGARDELDRVTKARPPWREILRRAEAKKIIESTEASRPGLKEPEQANPMDGKPDDDSNDVVTRLEMTERRLANVEEVLRRLAEAVK